MVEGYTNGYIQRTKSGACEGVVSVEGIDLSPISAVFFKKDADNYLWLKRKKVLEYDDRSKSYKEREAQPLWECYLKKQSDKDTIAYKGEFVFMRFRFSITGVWDTILGMDKKHRLNLFIERLPLSEQTIINSINERKRNDGNK
jgi:hypothetical protein